MLFRSLVAALGAGLALEVLASPLLRDESLGKRQVPKTHSLHERHTPHMEKHWNKRSRLPTKTMLPMRIGLKQNNLEAGHDRLMAM
jgi:tripeptidyl-peptidase-1